MALNARARQNGRPAPNRAISATRLPVAGAENRNLTADHSTTTPQRLSDCVAASLERYLNDLDGALPTALYDLVMTEVERPLLQIALREAANNQTRAAEILGLNRGTLRKKLKRHGLS